MPETLIATRNYRLSLVHLWTWAALATCSLLACFVIFAYLCGRQLEPLGLVVVGLFSFSYWIVYGLKFRLTVSSKCLAWIVHMGGQHSVVWQEIERAERQNMFGFPTLALWTPTGKEQHVVSFCLADPDGFRAAVLEAAGDDHIVYVGI
jgi:hypothetical protein